MSNNKGYVIAYSDMSDFYIPDALHIEKDDNLDIFEGDEEASKQAEKDGIKLIYNMKYVPNGVYLDTKENRKIIEDMLIRYPEYKKVIKKCCCNPIIK